MNDKFIYIVGRILQAIPTIMIITILVFFMIRIIPGDPATVMLGMKATPERVEALTRYMGLDKSLLTQFTIFLQNIFKGQLGDSIILRTPVTVLIANRLPLTLFLAFYAIIISILVSVPLSLGLALTKDSWFDQTVRAVLMTMLSTPSFWFGIILLILLGVKIPIFPVGGVREGFVNRLQDLFLPAVTLSLHMTAVLTRNLRDNIISILQSEHIVFAYAKGLQDRIVFVRHVLRNASISGITIVGLYMSWMVGGSVVIETVFAIPGMGYTMIQGIMGRDYIVVQGLTLVFGIMVSVIYLINDIVYSLLDPRVTL
ncbi:MAG: ABC transporter permease [Anaerolineaceae bacterium]|nr:ABC transporter permease [Anaerolineaceae bacterium]